MSNILTFTTPRAIAELNIAHYRKLLRTTLDKQTRATVERLLAEEQAKLAKFGSTSARSLSASRAPSD